MGSVLFGTAGAIAMGNEEEYMIEVTWINDEKSMISLVGTTFYNFFLSKLYENGESLLNKQILINNQNTINNQKRLKEECQNQIKEIEENYNFYYSELDGMFVNLPFFKNLIPYYRAEHENNYDNIYKYEKITMEYFDFLTNQLKDDIKKLYNDTIKEKIDSLIYLYFCGVCYGETDLTKIKRRWNQEKDINEIYTDEELETIANMNKNEIYDYFNRSFIENDLYEYLTKTHQENGYIFLNKDRTKQLEYLENLKDKLHPKVYKLCKEIWIKCENNIYSSVFDYFAFTNLSTIIPSYFILTVFINGYFGKEKVVMSNTKIEEKNTSNASISKYDDIKKIKELLDMGAITKEEFNQEKSKILNG